MSAPSPWLSVLVPVYNVEPYVGECIVSILSQADEGVEIVVVDDASPDGSVQIVQTLARQAQPGRIRLVSHAHNRGLSAARNTAMDHAQGRYGWFLDSDDVLLPGAIPSLRARVQRDAPDLVLCDFRLLRDSVRLHHRLRGEGHRRSFPARAGRLSPDRNALVKGLLEEGQLHAWSKIATLDAWRHARFPEGRYFEDMAVIPNLLAQVQRWQHVPSPWVGYRQRGDSIMATMTARKSRDLLASLMDLRGGFVQMLPGVSGDARLAVDYFSLRSLSSLARRAPRDDPALEHDCKRALRALFPEGIGSVLAQCRARGWWLRAWRAQRSLVARGWA